jgi:DNA-binding MarR family transcriptional regulator
MDHVADHILQMKFKISYTQFLALIGLNMLGKSSQRNLKQFTCLTDAGISKVIDSLIKLKCVTRKENLESRRENFIELTKKGHELTKKAMQTLDQEFTCHFNKITKPKQTEFTNTLDVLLNSLNEHNC